jgi:hypothetical protein
MTSQRMRVSLAVGVAVAAALFSCALFVIREEPGAPKATADFDARFAPLRARIGPRETVGYVTDYPGDTRPYYAARYVLAPARVLWQTPCDTVIGDFYNSRPTPDEIRLMGLDIVEDFGHGVLLLQRRARP